MLHIPATEELWECPFFDTHSVCSSRKYSLAYWRGGGSHLLLLQMHPINFPTVIILFFNSIVKLQIHCGLIGRKRQGQTDVYMCSPINQKTIILIWILKWCIHVRGGSSLRLTVQPKATSTGANTAMWIEETHSNPLDSLWLSETPH